MLQQLLDDLREYFEAKSPLTKQEQELLNRLSEGHFPILSIHRGDLEVKSFDMRGVTDSDMKRLADKMAFDYSKQLFWDSMETIADEELLWGKFPECPKCGNLHVEFDMKQNACRCMQCDQIWHDDLYVLVEFPDDATYFEENNIGYPTFESEDNGARYVPEYDYIQQFEKAPPANAYFKPVQWPESQQYLPDEEYNGDPAGDSIQALNECINDEKGRTDFGEQAVWVPMHNLKN